MAVAPKQSGLDILRKLVPLNTLSDKALAGLLDQAEFNKLSKGEHLFEKGDADHFNIYLLSGRVGLFSGNREMDLVEAGTDMARFPIAHQIPRKFTAIAKGKAEVVRIDNRILGELLAKAGNTTYEVNELASGETDDWMSQLLNSRVFQHIPAANIQSVMMRMEEIPVSKGESIINYGDEGDYFYLINKGRCSVQRPDENEGDPVEVAQLGPGSSFGEEALLSDKPRSSSVIMLTDGVLLRLNKNDFIQYVKQPLAKHVKLKDAVAQGAVLLDVRSTEEYERDPVKESINLPFASLRYQASSLDPDQKYFVYASDEQLSATAAYLLIEQGFDATPLEGQIDPIEKMPSELLESENVISLHTAQGAEAGSRAEKDTGDTEKNIAFLKRELEVSQHRLHEQQQQLQNFRLAFDEAKDLLGRHQGNEKRLREESQQLREQADELNRRLKETEQALEQQQETQAKLDESDKRARKLRHQFDLTEQKLQEITTERHLLEENIALLNQQREEQAEAYTSLEQQLKDTRTELEELKQSQEQQHQAHTEALERQQTALEEQIKILGERDEELQGVISSQETTQQQLQAVIVERDQAQQQLESLQQEQSEQLQALQESLDKQVQNNVDLQSELTTALGDGERTRQQESSFQERLQQLEAELQSSSKSLSDEQQKTKGAENRAAALESQLHELEEQNQQIQNNLDQAIQALDDQRAGATAREEEAVLRLQGLESELQTQIDQVTRLEQNLQQRNQVLDTAVSEKAELQQQLARLETLLQEKDEALQEVDRARAQQLQELTEAQEALTKLDEAHKGLTTQVAQREGLQGELTETQQELERLRDEMAAIHSERQQLQGELESSLDERQQQSEELKRLTQSLQQAEERIAQLNQEQRTVAQTVADAESLQERLAEANRALEVVKGHEQDLQRELERLQANKQSASDDVDKLTLELQEREAAQGQLQERIQQLEEEKRLQQEALDNAESARKAVESKQPVAAADGNDQVRVLQAELATLTDALEESDKSYNTLQEELKRLRDTQSAVEASEGAMADLQVALEQAQQQRDVAEQQREHLQEEVEELRGVMQQYVDGLESRDENGGIAALQAELNLVREQAEADVAHLKGELRQAQEQQSQMLSDSANVAENQQLREEIIRLEKALAEGSDSSTGSDKELQQLKLTLEDKRDEIERLKNTLESAQEEAEEAVFTRDEALEAKKLVDDALMKIQGDLEKERRPQELFDNRLASARPPKALDFSSAIGGGWIKGLLVGILLAFGAAEALSMLTGKGELIGLLTADDKQSELAELTKQTEVAVKKPEHARPEYLRSGEEANQAARSVVLSGGVIEPQKPKANTPSTEQATGATQQPPVIDEKPVSEKSATPPPPAKPRPDNRPATGTLLRDELRTGGYAPDLLYIRGDTFSMGSDRSQIDLEERPAHVVTLNNYAISRTEVTFEAYDRFARTTGRALPDDAGWGRGLRPVINVSWDDAQAYVDWLSTETGRNYRLPTEAEWEYAAAGGNEGYYWWGYELLKGKANCFNCGSQWDGVSTVPAGTFEANGYGLYNTAGNVQEWVDDCYHPNYDGAPTDGRSWRSFDCSERVARSSAFNKPAESMRITKRARFRAETQLPTLGFRIARSVQ